MDQPGILSFGGWNSTRKFHDSHFFLLIMAQETIEFQFEF